MRLRLAAGEEGYTIVAVVGSIAVVTLLASAALAATNGDLNLVQRDLDQKRAFAAAQAGIGDYSFHLNNDNAYWARCTNVPPPHAVNDVGSTTNRRPVPGETDAEYAIELLPATGQSACSTANPVGTMLEQGGTNTGTFRIRATGWAGDATASIVATYKRASFLDYIYFTQRETSDPVTYDSNTIASATTQCDKFIRAPDLRQSVPLAFHGGQPCDVISFITADQIDGPLHTNDALTVCGSPTFGRSPADRIEVSEAPTPANHNEGWYTPSQLLFSGGCSSGDPNFVGELETTAAVLTPPATNAKLRTIAADSDTLYSCQTRIQLSGSTMTVFKNDGTSEVRPATGVVYVENADCQGSPPSPACSTAYSPYTATYPTRSDCGTVRVHGTYSGQLTIAAENDVIVWDDVHRTGSGLLGLIANNFVRVRHPFSDTNDTVRGQCDGGSNQSGTQPDLNIDAAILAIQHSFIVDHYDCGEDLNELTVEGAISQKFRGAVGIFSGGTVIHGYEKNYEYDDRLRYLAPPEYLDPVQSAWHIQRETLDFP
jgi:Tfp pilus assembly protein PilX